MQSAPKLKWNKAKLLIYAGLLYLITLILEGQLFGTQYATWIWGGIYMLWGVTQTLRTKMTFYAVLGILCGLGAWHYQIADQGDTFLSMPTFIVHLTVILIFMFMFGEKIFDQHQTLEKNARRLFELAAEQLDEAANGFSSRPYALGNAEYTKKDVQMFARFLDASHVAKARIEENRVVLIFSLTTSPLTKPSLDDISYMAFDYDGNITTRISRADYRQYREELTFDQLCQNMGMVFKTMLEFYIRGEGQKALDWMK